jgi:BMFP domain-containing protein YqiC
LQDKIQQALGRMDLLLKENFDLKREIVFERKKYVDLQQAYQDLRNNMNEGNEEGSPDKR